MQIIYVNVEKSEDLLALSVITFLSKMTFEPKISTIGFYPKSENLIAQIILCIFAHCKIWIKRSSIAKKVLKHMVYPNHKMLNSCKFALSRIKIKSLYSTINKRKENPCVPYTARKMISLKKSQKIQLLWPNAQFSTGIRMNQEIPKW